MLQTDGLIDKLQKLLELLFATKNGYLGLSLVKKGLETLNTEPFKMGCKPFKAQKLEFECYKLPRNISFEVSKASKNNPKIQILLTKMSSVKTVTPNYF